MFRLKNGFGLLRVVLLVALAHGVIMLPVHVWDESELAAATFAWCSWIHYAWPDPSLWSEHTSGQESCSSCSSIKHAIWVYRRQSRYIHTLVRSRCILKVSNFGLFATLLPRVNMGQVYLWFGWDFLLVIWLKRWPTIPFWAFCTK